MFPGACPLKFGQREKIALKIGPDWGIFFAGDESGKDSLFRELPHTQDPGFLRPMANSGNRFWRETSKQPRDRVVGVWGIYFTEIFFPFFTNFFLRIFQVEIFFEFFFWNFFFGIFSIGGSSSGGTTSYAGIPIFTVLFWYYSSITTYPGL